MIEFEHVTTKSAVAMYESAGGVFRALLDEVRELSKKKPEATLNKSKVKLINNLLVDLMLILQAEPEGKYLQILEDEDLPQVSDALMVMVQFNAALQAFREKYYQPVETGHATSSRYWITRELLDDWRAEETELNEESGEEQE